MAGVVGFGNEGIKLQSVPFSTLNVNCLPSELLVQTPNPVVGNTALVPLNVPALSVIVRGVLIGAQRACNVWFVAGAWSFMLILTPAPDAVVHHPSNL